MLYLIALVCPPLAVLLCGRPFLAVLNILFTICFWVPGALHAMFIVNERNTKQMWMGVQRASMRRRGEIEPDVALALVLVGFALGCVIFVVAAVFAFMMNGSLLR